MLPDGQTAIDLFLDALWLEDGLAPPTPGCLPGAT